MCGIAGIWAPKAPSIDLRTHVCAMTSALDHRGPDDGGFCVEPDAGVALGMRRLAIIDVSPEGHQPMVSQSGRYAMVFNGEVYNYANIRKELRRDWRGHSDSEVILEAIVQFGLAAAVKKFVGMFALAVWDRKERCLHLVRDRVGIKPLYYGWSHSSEGGALLFGSELSALRNYPGFEPEIDRQALALFVRHSYIPAPYSIFRGVKKLPPGTIVTFHRADDRDAEPQPYWSMKEVAERGARDKVGSREEFIADLEPLLREAVGLRMIADVPLGAFLSGGVDSSLVVALMQSQSQRPVQTFSIGFEDKHFNEAAHAAAVAKHLGTEHTEAYVSEADTLSIVPRLGAMFDEPFADSSQIPTFLVSQIARRSVTVSLSGDGGDELFGGYPRFGAASRLDELRQSLPGVARSSVALLTGWLSRRGDRWSSNLAPLLPHRINKRLRCDNLERFSHLIRAEEMEPMYRALISQCPAPSRFVQGAQEPINTLADPSQWAELEDPHQRLQFLDSVTYLPDDILTKVDRASMAVALEARVPILDHRVVEFAWRTPDPQLARREPKWALRSILAKYVPPALTDRPKMGFGVPLAGWLRGPLKDWADGLLEPAKLSSQGYLDSAAVNEVWQRHRSGRNHFEELLWNFLMFQAWLEAGVPAKKQARPLSETMLAELVA